MAQLVVRAAALMRKINAQMAAGECRLLTHNLLCRNLLVSLMAEAAQLFQRIDTNGDGAVDFGELQAELADFGMPEDAIEALFFRLDSDGDTKVDCCRWGLLQDRDHRCQRLSLWLGTICS